MLLVCKLGFVDVSTSHPQGLSLFTG